MLSGLLDDGLSRSCSAPTGFLSECKSRCSNGALLGSGASWDTDTEAPLTRRWMFVGADGEASRSRRRTFISSVKNDCERLFIAFSPHPGDTNTPTSHPSLVHPSVRPSVSLSHQTGSSSRWILPPAPPHPSLSPHCFFFPF